MRGRQRSSRSTFRSTSRRRRRKPSRSSSKGGSYEPDLEFTAGPASTRGTTLFNPLDLGLDGVPRQENGADSRGFSWGPHHAEVLRRLDRASADVGSALRLGHFFHFIADTIRLPNGEPLRCAPFTFRRHRRAPESISRRLGSVGAFADTLPFGFCAFLLSHCEFVTLAIRLRLLLPPGAVPLWVSRR